MSYFNYKEMACPCCGKLKRDQEFLDVMNDIRESVGEPLHINSWYRCPSHDREIGGKGNHPTGRAADVRYDSGNLLYKLVAALIEQSITRFGIYRGRIHLDIVEDAPQEVVWYG